MKGLMFTLGAAALAMGASYAQSALLDEVSGYQYDGVALPTASTPAWTIAIQEGSITQSASGGILTVTGAASTPEPWLVNRFAGAEWSPTATGSTLELRLKVDSVADGYGRAGGIGIRTGTKIWLFTFGPNILEEVTAAESAAVVTNDAFHTYRMTIAGTAGPLNVYVDGNTTPLATFTGTGNAATLIDFGDNLDAEAGVVQWDYIQWTNTGVFAPIPEPASLSMLGLGALTMLRRSRR